MRIHMVPSSLASTIDGIDLRRFRPAREYAMRASGCRQIAKGLDGPIATAHTALCEAVVAMNERLTAVRAALS